MIRIFQYGTLLSLLALAVAAPVSGLSHDDAPQPDAMSEALALFRGALASQREDQRLEAKAYLEEHLLSHSLAPVAEARHAWQENLTRPAEDGTAPYAAEAVLWRLVVANVEAALEQGDPEALDLWMGLAADRSHRDGWSIPAWRPERAGEPHAQNVTKDLHAILASRARETLVTALLLERGGERGLARQTTDGAALLLAVFSDQAGLRLHEDLRRPFLENATRGRDLFSGLPAERKADTWTGLIAPLIALELDRTVESLDSFGMRNIDAVFSAARAAAEAPHLQRLLAEQAWLQYGADRAGLYLRGEGGVDALDQAYRAFHNESGDGDPAEVRRLAEAVRDALTPLALLQRGIVLKVETGGVRPDRVHEYGVTLVRPPLEGIAHYTITLQYDPDIVEIADIIPSAPSGRLPTAGLVTGDRGQWDVRLGEGEATLEVVPGEPERQSRLVAKLRLEARGPPESETPLRILRAHFVETDGDTGAIYRLRDGHATIAQIATEEDVAESAAAPVLVFALLIGHVLSRMGRRRPMGDR